MRTFPLLFVCSLLAGCPGSTDSGTPCDDTAGGDDTGAATGAPAASTNVDAVDLGVLCGASEAVVTLSNTGDAPLIVSDVLVGGGDWELVSGATEVAPGSSVDIVVVGTGGSGTLEILSNDPNNPSVVVALAGTANQAPTLNLSAASSVIAPGAQETFAGVADDDQDPALLAIQWSSDVDGVLSSAAPNTAGDISHDWDGALQSPGSHTISVTATDACGATVSESFSVCQNLGYTEETLDLTTWQYTGRANWDATNGWLELTDTTRYISGTAFQTSETVSSDNVSIGFSFFASGGSSGGADGLSVTAIDTSRMTTYQGSNGGSIGYGGLPGWSIEVDTWHNAEYNEPTTSDHVTFIIDGASTGLGEVSAAIHEVEDGQWHDMQVDVVGQQVTVSIDGIVYIDDPVPALTTFPAHVGFTAATGNVTNNHYIDALVVERFLCDG